LKGSRRLTMLSLGFSNLLNGFLLYTTRISRATRMIPSRINTNHVLRFRTNIFNCRKPALRQTCSRYRYPSWFSLCEKFTLNNLLQDFNTSPCLIKCLLLKTSYGNNRYDLRGMLAFTPFTPIKLGLE